jgi:predicted alpha/beta hydrolase family esterase
MKQETIILILPGLGGSGEKHWQSYWLSKYENAIMLVQDDWNKPKLKDWLAKLSNTILELDGPVVVVAHSLAVSLFQHWVSKNDYSNIRGALLVAPADVDSPSHTPDIIRGFSPMPLKKLPFPSIVVSSINDEYVNIDRAVYFAKQWHSDFVNVGAKGHINAESNLGFWQEGQLILERLMKTIKV